MQIMENLLHMALWASMILLVVLAIRPIIKNKSNRIMCILWLFVMFRFLCPVAVKVPMPWLNTAIDSMDEVKTAETADLVGQISKVEGIGSAIQNTRMDTAASAEFVETVESTKTAESVNRNDLMNLTDEMESTDQSNRMAQTDQVARMEKLESEDHLNKVQMNQVETENLTKRTSHPINIDPLKIFGVIWLFGTVIILGVGFRKYLLIKRALREAIYISEWENYPVKISDVSGVPLAFGIWKREIYVPVSFEEAKDGADDTFTRRQKELILWHETMHLKRLDPLRKVLAFVMVAVHWWNPLVWICVRLMDRDIEMACDEAVLERVGQKEKNEYAKTLLCFVEKQSGLTLITSFGESDAKSRIRNALSYRRSSAWMKVLMMLPVLILGGCLALNPTASAIDGQEKIEQRDDNIKGIEGNIEDKEETHTDDIVTDNRMSDSVQTEENDYKLVREYIKTSDMDFDYASEYIKIIDSYMEKYPEAKIYGELIYFNDDEIPDLVIKCKSVFDRDTSQFSRLFMYENGKVYSLMEENQSAIYTYWEKKGMLYNDDRTSYYDGINDENRDNYFLLNSEKKFDVVTEKKKFLRELREDPNYSYEQFTEEEEKSREWEYNGEKISKEEAQNILKERAGCDEYDLKKSYVSANTNIEHIKKDLTRLVTGNKNSADTSALTNSLYEKFRQGKEKVYFEQTDWTEYGLGMNENISKYLLPNGRGYSISEIIDVVRDVYFTSDRYDFDMPSDILKAQFAYLDCGQDGVPELAVEIGDTSKYYQPGHATIMMLIKEKEGKLQCTFVSDKHRAAINEAGVYAHVDRGTSSYGVIGMFDTNAVYHEVFAKEFIYSYCHDSNGSVKRTNSGGDFWAHECITMIEGKEYTYYVDYNSGEEVYSSMILTDPSCMRREEVISLEDEALEKWGCTKECLEADDLQFFKGDLHDIVDELRSIEVRNSIISGDE